MPEVFYDMEFDDFLLMAEGHREQEIFHLQMMRRQTMLLLAPHVKKMPSEFTLWPLPGDDEVKAAAKNATMEKHKRILEGFKRIELEKKRAEKLNNYLNGKS